MSAHFLFGSILMLLLNTSLSFASIPVQQSGFEKSNRYIDQGVFIGGFEHGVQSLVSVRRSFDQDTKVEKTVIEISSGGKKNSPERPGFYHISLQKKPRRLLIDMHNVVGSKMSEELLRKNFSLSRYFSDVKIFEDPMTKSMTLEIPLRETTKASMKIEVFELSSVGQPGRIVIDAKEF